eukprot:Hpha_TRINITY_DN32086_c0_g1::TRINITY_DN32086_c0_g1_i1::g.115910::m.115910
MPEMEVPTTPKATPNDIWSLDHSGALLRVVTAADSAGLGFEALKVLRAFALLFSSLGDASSVLAAIEEAAWSLEGGSPTSSPLMSPPGSRFGGRSGTVPLSVKTDASAMSPVSLGRSASLTDSSPRICPPVLSAGKKSLGTPTAETAKDLSQSVLPAAAADKRSLGTPTTTETLKDSDMPPISQSQSMRVVPGHEKVQMPPRARTQIPGHGVRGDLGLLPPPRESPVTTFGTPKPQSPFALASSSLPDSARVGGLFLSPVSSPTSLSKFGGKPEVPGSPPLLRRRTSSFSPGNYKSPSNSDSLRTAGGTTGGVRESTTQ